MRIIVTGGRDYTALATVYRTLREYDATPKPTLVHGAASGADALAAFSGKRLGWIVDPVPANWEFCVADCRTGHRRRRRNGSTYCPQAGPRRNQEMVDKGGDLLIAFPGGSGTADCVRRARAAGIPVREVQP